jgi:hypothetical protein
MAEEENLVTTFENALVLAGNIRGSTRPTQYSVLLLKASIDEFRNEIARLIDILRTNMKNRHLANEAISTLLCIDTWATSELDQSDDGSISRVLFARPDAPLIIGTIPPERVAFISEFKTRHWGVKKNGRCTSRGCIRYKNKFLAKELQVLFTNETFHTIARFLDKTVQISDIDSEKTRLVCEKKRRDLTNDAGMSRFLSGVDGVVGAPRSVRLPDRCEHFDANADDAMVLNKFEELAFEANECQANDAAINYINDRDGGKTILGTIEITRAINEFRMETLFATSTIVDALRESTPSDNWNFNIVLVRENSVLNDYENQLGIAYWV